MDLETLDKQRLMDCVQIYTAEMGMDDTMMNGRGKPTATSPDNLGRKDADDETIMHLISIVSLRGQIYQMASTKQESTPR